MPEPEKVTEEQASAALSEIYQSAEEGIPVQTQEPEPAPVEEPSTEEAPAVETEPEAESAPEAASEGDDVASLKRRLQERDTQAIKDKEEADTRWKAFQARAAENERILRDRYLRKSSITDKAMRVLRAIRSQEGVPEADVDGVIREIESTLNPASASYVQPSVGPEYAVDAAITLRSFLNEKRLTDEEAADFGNWMETEGRRTLSPREQAVANQSLDGFLSIAHSKWQYGVREKDREAQRAATVEATRSVQRTQKEAARAASASPAAPRKQTSGKTQLPDLKKMSKAEKDLYVATLLKQSVEQYE